MPPSVIEVPGTVVASSVILDVRGLRLCHETMSFAELRSPPPGKSEENTSQFFPYNPPQSCSVSLVSV
jgi:hypothetical protein